MKDYGMAVSFTSEWTPSQPVEESTLRTLQRSYEESRRHHPEWGLPEWNWDMVKKLFPPQQAFEWNGCPTSWPDEELTTELTHPEACQCDGTNLIRGKAIEGQFEHQWGWYVAVDH